MDDDDNVQQAQRPTSATLCWRLWRRLRDRHELGAVAKALRADLSAVEADLRAVAQRHRGLRRPGLEAAPCRPWTPAQTASAAALLDVLRDDPRHFADVLLRAGLDDDLLDTFVVDLMGEDDADPSVVVGAVLERDPDAGWRLLRAVLGRVPLRHLDGVVRDLVETGLDLFDESAPDTVAFVSGACGRIVRATLGARLPVRVRRLAAVAAPLRTPLEVVFVDWIGAALKRPGDDDLRPGSLVNRIVVADNLAAVIGTGRRPVPDRCDDDLGAFARDLLGSRTAQDAAAGRTGPGIWTVDMADMARLARAAGTGDDVPEGTGYAVLRRRGVLDAASRHVHVHDDVRDGAGVRALMDYLERRSDLVLIPGASLHQQLQGTDQRPALADRVLDVLHRTTPAALARDDFAPLVRALLQRQDADDAHQAAVVAVVGRQVQAARHLLQVHGQAVEDAETRAAARPVLDAIRSRTRRFVADLRRAADGAAACDGVAVADGALVCAACRAVVLDRAGMLARFTKNALAAARRRFGPALAQDGVTERVRAYIESAQAGPVPAPACSALGRVLDRIAGAYPDLVAFRAAFGGPITNQASFDDVVFDEAASVLSGVGDGLGDDWAKICTVYEVVSEAVIMGTPSSKANPAADIIAALAYVVVRGRARRLGAVLTVMGENRCGGQISMHLSVAVNALLALFAIGNLDGSGVVPSVPGADLKPASIIEA